MGITLNFHPQGRMLLMRGKVEKLEAGRPCDSISWYQALAALTPEPPGPTATNSHNFPHILIPAWGSTTGPEWLPHNYRLCAQPYDHVPRGRCPILQTFANQTYYLQKVKYHWIESQGPPGLQLFNFCPHLHSFLGGESSEWRSLLQ